MIMIWMDICLSVRTIQNATIEEIIWPSTYLQSMIYWKEKDWDITFS